MPRFIKVLALAGTVLALSAGPALAANPHIVGSPSATVSGNTLTLKASVAGLGNVETVTFTLEGTVDVFSQCYNRGGKNPAADNKQETLAVSSTETFPVRNGRTNATFTVTPLSSLDCPGNQIVVIESVSFDLDLVHQGTVLYTFSG
jgi:hypothetical protein